MFLLDEKTLYTYLYYGNLPFPRRDEFLFNLVDHKRKFIQEYPHIVDSFYDDNPKEKIDALKFGIETWKKVIKESLEESEYNNEMHVVPLSGGLDSRAILAGLLEYLPTSNIITVTYGWKGTLDFEIGRKISKVAGVKNISVDTSKFTWDTEKLVAACKQTEWDCFSTVAYVHSYLGFGRDNIYWTGFMGDPLVGGHLPNKPSYSWKEAMDKFVDKHIINTINLQPSYNAISPYHYLPQEPLVDKSLLGYDEQFDLGLRQAILISRGRFCNGYDWKAPFLNSKWSGMCLNLPENYLRNQIFYKNVLIEGFPKLFKNMPEKNYGLLTSSERSKLYSYGRKIINHTTKKMNRILKKSNILPYKPNPKINQIDIDWALRERNDVKKTIFENLEDLQKRGIVDWIDTFKIFDDHQKKKANYGDALKALALLEIRIKSGVITTYYCK